ncbi:MAG: recombinase family protein [Chlamydiia bacterium]|nr:recombinase family protein [Chlamydiia bacterium]
MKIGYARASIFGEALNPQIDQLKEFGCKEIIIDKISSNNLDRKELEEALRILQKDDILVVSKLDILGPRTKDILNVCESIKAKNASFVALDIHINISSKTESLIISILGAISELETNTRKENQEKGIVEARKKGIYKGRAPLKKAIINNIKLLKEEGLSLRSIAGELNLSTTSVHKYLKREISSQ